MYPRLSCVRRVLATLAVLILLGISSGCAGPQIGPRFVNQVTSSKQSVKLLYHQKVGAQTKSGLIECDRNPDGTLLNCHNVNVNFNE